MKNEQLCTKVHPGRVRDPWEQEPLRRVPGVRLSCLMVKISSATPKMPLQPSAQRLNQASTTGWTQKGLLQRSFPKPEQSQLELVDYDDPNPSSEWTWSSLCSSVPEFSGCAASTT